MTDSSASIVCKCKRSKTHLVCDFLDGVISNNSRYFTQKFSTPRSLHDDKTPDPHLKPFWAENLMWRLEVFQTLTRQNTSVNSLFQRKIQFASNIYCFWNENMVSSMTVKIAKNAKYHISVCFEWTPYTLKWFMWNFIESVRYNLNGAPSSVQRSSPFVQNRNRAAFCLHTDFANDLKYYSVSVQWITG